jgi:hypothetical protein
MSKPDLKLRLEQPVYDAIATEARRQGRTITNLAAYLLKQAVIAGIDGITRIHHGDGSVTVSLDGKPVKP